MTKHHWQLPEKLAKGAHMMAVEELNNIPRHLLDRGNPNHPDNFTCTLFGYEESELLSEQYKV